MPPERANSSVSAETRVNLKGGGQAVLTLADVAVASLRTPEDPTYEVFAEIGGRNLPALLLVRNALEDREPHNTNAAEKALHTLGISILVRRRFDATTGDPVRLSLDQRASSQ